MQTKIPPESQPPTKTLTAMPVWLQYSVPQHECTVTVAGEGEDATFLQKFRYKKSLRLPVHQFDAYAIREAFLRISTEAEIVEFLHASGPFRADVHETTLEDIRGWQTFFKEWMLGGYDAMPFPPVVELGDPENDRIGGSLSWDIGLNRETMLVEAYVNCDSVVEAIGATVSLDLLEGVHFGACGWCKSLFEITKENGRQYCTQQCAHRAGQKRRRAEAKTLRGITNQAQSERAKKGI